MPGWTLLSNSRQASTLTSAGWLNGVGCLLIHCPLFVWQAEIGGHGCHHRSWPTPAIEWRIKSAPSPISGSRSRASINRIATIEDGAQPEIWCGDLPPKLMAGVRIGPYVQEWVALRIGHGGVPSVLARASGFELGIGPSTLSPDPGMCASRASGPIRQLWGFRSMCFRPLLGLVGVGRGVSVPPVENVRAR